MSERDADDLQKKYGPALDAALGKAGDRIEEIHREIEAAAGLLEELTAITAAPAKATPRPASTQRESRSRSSHVASIAIRIGATKATASDSIASPAAVIGEMSPKMTCAMKWVSMLTA